MAVDALNDNALVALEVSEGWTVGGNNNDALEGDRGFAEDGDNVDGSEDNEAVETVGVTLCLWQLPVLIETSSMAKSPVKEDPTIPSNVTYIQKKSCKTLQLVIKYRFCHA